MKKHRRFLLLWATFVLAMFSVKIGIAGTSQSSQAAQQDKISNQATGNLKWIEGPRSVAMLDQAVIKLPKDYAFLEGEAARQELRKIGSDDTVNVVGMIAGPGGNWYAVVAFEKVGYISEAEVKDWNENEILVSLQKNIKKPDVVSNATLPETNSQVWVEEPLYDPIKHHLAWAVGSTDKEGKLVQGQGIQYHASVLGREGYFSLNLVTDLKQIEQDKPHAKVLLTAIEFKERKKYADFNTSTDKVAPQSITHLIGGAVMKKPVVVPIIVSESQQPRPINPLIVIMLGCAVVASILWARYKNQLVVASQR